MKKVALLVVLLTTAVLSQQYNLVWSDEFSGNSLDLGKWEYEVDCWGGGNNEQQCYTARGENVRVGNGVLTLQARVERYQGSTSGCTNNNENSCTWTRDFTSGRIHSKFRNGASWKFGKIETRAKLPKGNFLWPAIWMLPSDTVYGGWAASGEIDIMEARGQLNELHLVEGTLHFGGTWPNNVYEGSGKVGVAGINDFSADFHNFAVIWTADSVEWQVDGVRFRQATLNRSFYSGRGTNPYRANRQPFDQRFHMLLNLAVGGGFFPASIYGNIDINNARSWPKTTMEVDYVRVYQLGNAPPPPPPNNPPPPPPPSNNPPTSCTQVGGGTGSGLLATYYSDLSLGNAIRTVVDPTIGFDWGLGSPAGVPADRFSVRWQGQIQARMSGPWTFSTVTDDGIRLWVNNVLLIDDWRDHGNAQNSKAITLTAGVKYPFKVEFYDNTGGASIFVRWSHPCAPTAVLPPAAQLYPVISTATVRDDACVTFVGTGKGLKGDYYHVDILEKQFNTTINVTRIDTSGPENITRWSIEDSIFTNVSWNIGKLLGSRLDKEIDFAWDQTSFPENITVGNETITNPLKDVKSKGLYVIWNGYVQPLTSENYVFYTDSTNGVRLTVDGQVIIDNMTPHPPAQDESSPIRLSMGKGVSVKLELLSLTDFPVVALYWSAGECFDRSVISGSQLYTEMPPIPPIDEFEASATFLAPFIAALFALLF